VYSARRMNIEKGVPIFPLSHLGGKDRHQPNSFQFPFPEDEREGVPYEEPWVILDITREKYWVLLNIRATFSVLTTRKGHSV
jgi:hypothetical protein